MTDSPGYLVTEREDERLAALAACAILDTPRDARFDALVGLAASYFDTPIALVSLIDRNRQWYKASIGIEVTETPREFTFCTHALHHPEEVLVVEDATQDPRFRDNPFVTGAASVRFYAGAPILADNGEPVGTVCVVDSRPRTIGAKDREFLTRLAISAGGFIELHRKTLALRELAERDSLTGLLNRRALEADLEGAVAIAREGRPCGVLYVDIDHFKAVNDTYGHEFGDLFLCAISRRLEASVRKADRVMRLGGDEFVVLLANELDEPALGVVGRRILDRCAAPLMIQGVAMAAQVSIGGALAPRHAIEAKALLKAADEALYDAKRLGRGRLVVAKPGRSLAAKSAGLEDDLRQAIADNALQLVWQPCLGLADGVVRGYEALARWSHPQFGPISPEVFVPLAENGGMSRDFDAWVLRRACQVALDGPPGVQISVNMSAYSLCEADVAATLIDVLTETGLPPERIVLEITERTLINDPASALEAMTRLNAMGVSFALDDFGAGYAALSYLSKYPFRVLKLDRSLILDIEPQSRALTVVAGIIEIARRLGMTVIAEGVETEIQAALLREAGCEAAQGYLFARPGPLPKREAAAAA